MVNESPVVWQDPIQTEHDRLRREEFVAQLFRPIHDHDELLDVRWLVDGFLPIGYLGLLAGSPKAGKTCFATALALAIANGVPFAGRQTRQSSVLWIAGEESGYERHSLFKDSPLASTSTPIYTCYEPFWVDEEEYLDYLVEWINQTEARFIVVDPLMACMKGRSLANGWNCRRTLQALKQFCGTYSVSALVLHHTKRDYVRGRLAVADNAQLSATASMSWVLTSSPLRSQSLVEGPSLSCERSHGGGPGWGLSEPESVDSSTTKPEQRPIVPSRLVRLQCEGRGYWANRDMFFVSDGPLDYRPTDLGRRSIAPFEDDLTICERRVVAAMEDGLPRTSTEIIEKSEIREGTARNVITNLRRKGWLTHYPGSKWPPMYIRVERPSQKSESDEGLPSSLREEGSGMEGAHDAS